MRKYIGTFAKLGITALVTGAGLLGCYSFFSAGIKNDALINSQTIGYIPNNSRQMGPNRIIDINSDGVADAITNPEDSYRWNLRFVSSDADIAQRLKNNGYNFDFEGSVATPRMTPEIQDLTTRIARDHAKFNNLAKEEK